MEITFDYISKQEILIPKVVEFEIQSSEFILNFNIDAVRSQCKHQEFD